MNLFDILFIGALLAVTVALVFGLKALFTPGEAARSQSNRLMRLRVGLQAVAVLLLVVAMWWRSTHGA
ncbi:MAG: twin transmembrane helix small protein [Pseudomonadota bacterium]